MLISTTLNPVACLQAFLKMLLQPLRTARDEEKRMKKKLHRYVGRIVRLNQNVFQQLKDKALSKGIALENSFLVAEVKLNVKKLICYGASFRIVVDASDVVLV